MAAAHPALPAFPAHVAVIMDGNGRWAAQRGETRAAGHAAGARAVHRVVEAARVLGVGTLTLYAFSFDNWKRPSSEVYVLMHLFAEYLRREAGRCRALGVQLTILGRRDRLSKPLLCAIDVAEAALVAGGVSWVAIRRKAARTGQSLSAGPARRFALAFAPALVAGAVLTVVLQARGLQSLLPGMWLTVYGAAVTAGGVLSVRPVPIMGAAFLLLGAACFALQPVGQLYFLAAGFGGLHLLFGLLIARHHGG